MFRFDFLSRQLYQSRHNGFIIYSRDLFSKESLFSFVMHLSDLLCRTDSSLRWMQLNQFAAVKLALWFLYCSINLQNFQQEIWVKQHRLVLYSLSTSVCFLWRSEEDYDKAKLQCFSSLIRLNGLFLRKLCLKS